MDEGIEYSLMPPPTGSIEIKPAAPYVKDLGCAHRGIPFRLRRTKPYEVAMPKAITLKEIERIFTITDALGISREALVIPLRPEEGGRVSTLKSGKLEIVIPRDDDFELWLSALEAQIRSIWPAVQG